LKGVGLWVMDHNRWNLPEVKSRGFLAKAKGLEHGHGDHKTGSMGFITAWFDNL